MDRIRERGPGAIQRYEWASKLALCGMPHSVHAQLVARLGLPRLQELQVACLCRLL